VDSVQQNETKPQLDLELEEPWFKLGLKGVHFAFNNN
jgi:hypothetical protein